MHPLASVSLLALALAYAIAALAGACRSAGHSPLPVPPPGAAIQPRTEWDAILANAAPRETVAAMLDEGGAAEGLAEILVSRCQSNRPEWGGRAIQVFASPARAGVLTTATFQHSFVHLRDEPPAWLLVALKPGEPVSLAPWGMPGCLLLVNPHGAWTFAPGEPPVTRGRGTVSIAWTPPANLVGLDVWAQLVWTAPGANPAGSLVSPAVHWRVGSAELPGRVRVIDTP